MSDAKTTALTALLGTDVADGDLVPIVDVSASATKKITRNELRAAIFNSEYIQIPGGLEAVDGFVVNPGGVGKSFYSSHGLASIGEGAFSYAGFTYAALTHTLKTGVAGDVDALVLAADGSANFPVGASVDGDDVITDGNLAAALAALGVTVVALTDDTSAPAVTNVGAAASVSYGYKVVAKTLRGHTVASDEGTTDTGNDVLDGDNYNHIAWSAVDGAIAYDVYRVTGGASQGRIASGVTDLFLDDQGLSGDDSEAPTTNTTGFVKSVGGFYGGDISANNPLPLITGDPETGAVTIGDAVNFYGLTWDAYNGDGLYPSSPADLGGPDKLWRTLYLTATGDGIQFINSGDQSVAGQLKIGGSGLEFRGNGAFFGTTAAGAEIGFSAPGGAAGLTIGYPVVPDTGEPALLYSFDQAANVGNDNSYYVWFDSRGVFRIKAINGQAIAALYNPTFEKYVAGTADFERIIYGQWNADVAQIGVEAGGTGTLRALQLMGAGVKFPTVDPLIVGAYWDNGTALVRSAGP